MLSPKSFVLSPQGEVGTELGADSYPEFLEAWNFAESKSSRDELRFSLDESSLLGKVEG